jgi:hypothetical protein
VHPHRAAHRVRIALLAYLFDLNMET